ncbi:MAG: adenylyltransferase/cytidyltransferase family protein [Lentisphaeria bacterium]|nr:adenylyltransferase/cytidyltransferase family protein [Lentisphaeria bacterium]MBQ7394166.1 adenylyltransferase/cytidyltransferase family protein [Lentisphaeria bacterium]
MDLDAALRYRETLRRQGKKLVVTNGCFDLLHRGHATYLAAARECGDALLILVNSDASVRALKGPSRPVVDEYSRAFLLASLRAVDAAVVFDGSRCDRELAVLKPDIYVKAGDYTLETLNPDERTALEDAGCKIVFMPFVAGFSTTGTLKKILG